MPAYPSRDNCHIWNSNLLATGEENRITKPECISEIARATGAGKIFLFNFISGVQLLPQAAGTVFASLSLASCSTHLEGKLLSDRKVFIILEILEILTRRVAGSGLTRSSSERRVLSSTSSTESSSMSSRVQTLAGCLAGAGAGLAKDRSLEAPTS